jgi:hypothetical protein
MPRELFRPRVLKGQPLTPHAVVQHAKRKQVKSGKSSLARTSNEPISQILLRHRSRLVRFHVEALGGIPTKTEWETFSVSGKSSLEEAHASLHVGDSPAGNAGRTERCLARKESSGACYCPNPRGSPGKHRPSNSPGNTGTKRGPSPNKIGNRVHETAGWSPRKGPVASPSANSAPHSCGGTNTCSALLLEGLEHLLPGALHESFRSSLGCGNKISQFRIGHAIILSFVLSIHGSTPNKNPRD